jgi:hypothetical protein
MIEEAARARVPTVVVDVKGDRIASRKMDDARPAQRLRALGVFAGPGPFVLDAL